MARRHAGNSRARESELSRLKAFVDGEQESAQLIVGEHGSGKSTLLASIEAAYPAIYHPVRANASETRVPLSGLSAVLAAFQEPEMVSLSAELIEPHKAETLAATLPLRLLAFFKKAERSRTLLLIDDLDVMDQLSQSVIATVANRLGADGLSLLITVTELPVSPLTSIPRLTLLPLPLAESMSLLDAYDEPPINEAIRQILADASHGNPGALMHNVLALTAEQLAGDAPVTMPFRVSRAVAAEPDGSQTFATRRVLLARLSCSRLSSEASVTQSSEASSDQLDDLLAEGIVVRDHGYLRLNDPLLRSRVYWSLGAASRTDYHASAARLEVDHAPGLACWHRSWLQPTRVTPHELLAAAVTFADGGLPFQAVELAERAVAVKSPEYPLSLDLARLARTLLLHGELSHAARYVRLSQRQPDAAAHHGMLALLRAWVEFLSTQQLGQIDLDYWAGTHSRTDPGRAVTALATFALLHCERWETDRARAALDRARQVHDRGTAGTQEILDWADMTISALEGDPAPTVKAFSQSSNQRTVERSPLRLFLIGRSLTFIGRHNDARLVLKSIVDMEPSPPPLWRTSATFALAENEIIAGNHFAAIATIDWIESSAANAQLHRNALLLLRVWYWLAQDDQGEASAAIAACHRSFAASDNPALTARLEAYQGAFALVHGNLEEAIAFLGSAVSFAARLELPALSRYRADLIEAYVLAGRHDEAQNQLQEMRARSMPPRTRTAVLLSARAHALVARGEASIEAFHQAVALWQPGDPQFELGRILLSFADRLSELGNHQESREQYLAARIIFTQLGASSWAKKADTPSPLHQSRNENPLLSTLNWDEQAVAGLVCRGMRNKEIAQELYVSLRTVEVRLTRIYHKLGVRSRAHLVSLLGGLDFPPDEATGL